MRKRIGTETPEAPPGGAEQWLDLNSVAEVEVTSEDPAHPIEHALTPGHDGGWRAAGPGEQTIRLLFDAPQRIRRIQLLFIESQVERAQEFALGWGAGEGQPPREIVRQQYHFSPSGAVRELEDYRVELDGVQSLELRITPDTSRGPARASLEQLRLA